MSIGPITSGSWMPAAAGASAGSASESGKAPFLKVIDQLLGGANLEQARADHAVEELAMGHTDNIHDVMLSVARADLSFRMILEIRNRLNDAYAEIMRMQV
jgi:flagellar hook-basal body complex protein FliE